MGQPQDQESPAGGLSAVDRSVSGTPTEAMVDAFIAFADKATILHHPDVPYLGTANGDSEAAWRRRLITAALAAAMAANVQHEGCGADRRSIPLDAPVGRTIKDY